MAEFDTDNGADAQVEDVKRLHIERLSAETIALNIYTEDGKLRVFTLAANSPILIKEAE
jgi:hypothetical protein